MAEPPITLRAAHDSGRGNAPVTRIVIHATCPDVGYSAASAPGTSHGTALYFAHPPNGNVGSAHYVCGVDREEHCVPEGVIAWHAPPNKGSLGIEITAEGGNYARNYTREQWLSPQVWPAVERAAARCRDLCDRYGIPKVKLTAADLLAGERGICGHVDVSNAWHQTDHTDPNNGTFPWDRFMAAVTEEDDMPSRDELIDIVREAFGSITVPKSPGGVGPANIMTFLGRIADDSATGARGVAAILAAVGQIKSADVDEKQLATYLTDALRSTVVTLGDADLKAIGKAVADEEARRLSAAS